MLHNAICIKPARLPLTATQYPGRDCTLAAQKGTRSLPTHQCTQYVGDWEESQSFATALSMRKTARRLGHSPLATAFSTWEIVTRLVRLPLHSVHRRLHPSRLSRLLLHSVCKRPRLEETRSLTNALSMRETALRLDTWSLITPLLASGMCFFASHQGQ